MWLKDTKEETQTLKNSTTKSVFTRNISSSRTANAFCTGYPPQNTHTLHDNTTLLLRSTLSTDTIVLKSQSDFSDAPNGDRSHAWVLGHCDSAPLNHTCGRLLAVSGLAGSRPANFWSVADATPDNASLWECVLIVEFS